VKGIIRWFGWFSAAIVVGYFIVGLWPFAFHPPNQVGWLPGRSGLHFKKSGVAYDPVPLPAPGLSNVTNQSLNFTLEIWARADREPDDNVYNLLTIHNDRLPVEFVICQWQRECLLRGMIQHPITSCKISELGLRDALSVGKSSFITIRGDGAGTDFYSDGLPAGHYPQFVLQPEAMAGQLILGNDSSGKHPWSGILFGLAIYQRALEPAEIARHQGLWMQSPGSLLTNNPGLTALYLFDEGGGQWVKDSSGNRHRVIIPKIFQAVHREFLIPLWKDLAYDGPDYSDIAVNILGFIPFGFCFFIHRRSVHPALAMKNVSLVVLTGAAVSLTIEIIQAWMPNRVSSTTDLLANTLGSLLGVVLVRILLPRITIRETPPSRSDRINRLKRQPGTCTQS